MNKGLQKFLILVLYFPQIKNDIISCPKIYTWISITRVILKYIFITPESSLVSLSSQSQLLPRGNHYSDFHHTLVLSVLVFFINSIIQYTLIYVWTRLCSLAMNNISDIALFIVWISSSFLLWKSCYEHFVHVLF